MIATYWCIQAIQYVNNKLLYKKEKLCVIREKKRRILCAMEKWMSGRGRGRDEMRWVGGDGGWWSPIETCLCFLFLSDSQAMGTLNLSLSLSLCKGTWWYNTTLSIMPPPSVSSRTERIKSEAALHRFSRMHGNAGWLFSVLVARQPAATARGGMW